MKKYNIKVNGVTYEVEVDEVKGDFSSPELTAVPAPSQEVVAPTPKIQVKKTSAPGEKVECPMPGTVLKVNVKAGDDVKKGHVMFILEAMKMENEIMAPRDGSILEVGVVSGAIVNTGDVLAVIQ